MMNMATRATGATATAAATAAATGKEIMQEMLDISVSRSSQVTPGSKQQHIHFITLNQTVPFSGDCRRGGCFTTRIVVSTFTVCSSHFLCLSV
jgi:hypothetical protein